MGQPARPETQLEDLRALRDGAVDDLRLVAGREAEIDLDRAAVGGDAYLVTSTTYSASALICSSES